MSRIPIRIRVTLAFAVAMTVVLAAVGAFLYVRLADSLLEQLDDSLQARAAGLAALVGERGAELAGDQLVPLDDEGVAQVLGPDGAPVVSSPGAGSDPLVSEGDVARARSAPLLVEQSVVQAFGDEAGRFLLTPVVSGGQTFVLVLGASLEDRSEALDGLLTQLYVVGPLALVLASLAGYVLASAALRPVEAMRRRAAEVSSEQAGQRLPLPRARDEIRRLGETLNEMLARLESGLARERRFVADASHELRTPLALLQTELELALRHPRSPEELEDALRSAAEEVDRLSRLAEDLLVLARVDEGALRLERSEFLVSDLLQAVARRFAARAAAEGRALEVVVHEDTPVTGDRLRLEQALGNLVDNAFRHGAGTVRLEAERADARIELRVSDEGGGFPPSFLPLAFDRFSRADEARSTAGTGLGLAIVAAIARSHDGEASAANGPTSGATVTLVLPADGASRPTSAHEEAPDRSPLPEPGAEPTARAAPRRGVEEANRV